MNSFRFGMQRYFIGISGVNIISYPQFNDADSLFINILRDIKATGKGEIELYPEIEPDDIRKLYASFDNSTLAVMQEKVSFDIIFYLCHRGRENLRKMTKSSYYVSHDATGKQYIYQCGDELNKNHNIGDTPNDTNGEGRIYETNYEDCPVR